MYDPSMRVLTVLELLQTKERMSGAELAERLEVSVRTVQRYVARLQDLGVPVTSTRGPGGFYRLRPGFRLPPMMFGTEEALALVLGLDALTYLGLGEIAPQATGAKVKLERVLPIQIREQVDALRAALELERPRGIVDADAAVLTQLAAAIHASRRAALTYEARGGEVTSREVDPLGLLQHEGRWFLAGYCHLRGGRRLFRVDRIKGVAQRADTFERPAAFDLRAFVREGLSFAHESRRVTVWLALTPEALPHVLPHLPPDKTVTREGDGLLLRCTITDLEAFALSLLYLRCKLEVREPLALKEVFQRVAKRALEVSKAGVSN